MGPTPAPEAQPQTMPQPGIASANPDVRPWPPMGNVEPVKKPDATQAWGPAALGPNVATGAPIIPGIAPAPEQPPQSTWSPQALGPDVAPAFTTPLPSINPDANAVAPAIAGINPTPHAEQTAQAKVAWGGPAALGPDVAAALNPGNAPLNFGGAKDVPASPTFQPQPEVSPTPAPQHVESFVGMPGSVPPPMPAGLENIASSNPVPTTPESISTVATSPTPEPALTTSEQVNTNPETLPSTGNPELDKLMQELAKNLGAEVAPVEDVITKGEEGLNKLSPNSPLLQEYRDGFKAAVTFSLSYKNKA